MMPLYFWIVLLAAALASCVGGLLLCLRAWSRKALFAMISAGAGLLLAITMLDLLPHVIQGESLRMMPFVLVGFAALFAMELLGKSAGGEFGSPSVIGVLGGFLLHAFVEGVSLLASLKVDAEIGVSVLLAMLLHKIPDGVTVASLMLAATNSRKKALWGGDFARNGHDCRSLQLRGCRALFFAGLVERHARDDDRDFFVRVRKPPRSLYRAGEAGGIRRLLFWRGAGLYCAVCLHARPSSARINRDAPCQPKKRLEGTTMKGAWKI
ncbi:ZIP family metal transporter [Brevibacillus gelatini]